MEKYNDPFKNIWEVQWHYDNGLCGTVDYMDAVESNERRYVYGTETEVKEYIKNFIEYKGDVLQLCHNEAIVEDLDLDGISHYGELTVTQRHTIFGDRDVHKWVFFDEKPVDDHVEIVGMIKKGDAGLETYIFETDCWIARPTTLDDIIITL